jgi:hypothetical protein
MKTCFKCGIDRELIFFHKDKKRKDGLYSYCKYCRSKFKEDSHKIKLNFIKSKLIKPENSKFCGKCISYKDISLFHRSSNACKECRKKIPYKPLSEKARLRAKEYNKTKRLLRTPEKIEKDKINRRNYKRLNKDKVNLYERTRIANSIQAKLAHNLRNRFERAFYNNTKTGSAVRDLGCSINELIVYLESKFKPGMTWDNYGKFGWHIDHIIPLSAFDLTDYEQVKIACNYNNLQPLWAQENLSKHNKIGVNNVQE